MNEMLLLLILLVQLIMVNKFNYIDSESTFQFQSLVFELISREA